MKSVSWKDVDWSVVRQITLIPYGDDVEGWVLGVDKERLRLPHDEVLPGEDAKLDTVLRIGLQEVGFRRQGFFPMAIDGNHLVVWCFGGFAPNSEVKSWRGSAPEGAELLAGHGSELLLAADQHRRMLTAADYYSLAHHVLEPAYLSGSTPQAGSGFGGDAEHWRAARSIICDAIDRDGTFLDVGCANGLLMESVTRWSAEKGITVEPYGVDISEGLVREARRRLPQWTDRIWLGNAIDWTPPENQRFDLVHTLVDCVPAGEVRTLVEHLLESTVADGGRLVLSSYIDIGARNLHAAEILRRNGFVVAGETRSAVRPGGRVGAPSAWINRD